MRIGVKAITSCLVLITICLSSGRWIMEAMPRKVWRGEPARVFEFEYCPDGMCDQIQIFSYVLEGQPRALESFLHHIRVSHQSSTYLVSILAGPLVVAGLEPAQAFMTVSAAASVLLVMVLLWLCQEALPGTRWQIAVMVLFLFHPATVRCFVRPQTDALMACFTLLAIAWGYRLATRPVRWWEWMLLVLTQFAATLVKIHALSLLLAPPVVAFFCGLRGRRLWGVAACASYLPAWLWTALFAVLDLFGTITNAWQYLGQFYHQWTPWSVGKVLLVCVVPLFSLGLCHPKLFRGLAASCLAMVAGFALILVVAGIPPVLRFQFPALAPLVLLAVMAAKERFGPKPWVFLMLWTVAAWGFVLGLGLIGLELYGRYLGPTRDLSPLDRFFIHLM